MNTLATPTLHSNSIDDVYREKMQAEDRCLEIDRAMAAAQAAGDDDSYVELSEAYHNAYSLVVALEGRLMELEDRAAREEERGRRAWYQWASL